MLLTLLAYLLMVTVLVAAHELGHYIAAKQMGMDVEEFAIGMGPGKWVYARKNGTEFTVRPIPLGGFVRISGMMPEEDGSETKVVNGFYSKSPMARIWVLFAGPLFSVLAGLALLIPIWATFGMVKPVNDPVLAFVSEDGAAHKSGLRQGDRILTIDGKPVKTFFDIVSNVRDRNGKPVIIDFERKGVTGTVFVRPDIPKEPTPVFNPDLSVSSEMRVQSRLGVAYPRARVPVGFGEATWAAIRSPYDFVVEIVSRFSSPARLMEAVGGPESMIRYTNMAVNENFIEFIQLAGGISMSLAIFNLLPIAPLDGGQIAVAFAELLRRGRRLSYKTQNVIQSVGLSMVLLMFVSFITIDRIKWSRYAAEEAKAAAKKGQK